MRSRRPFIGSAVALSLLLGPRVARADDRPTFADRSDEEVRDNDRAWGLLLNPLATAVGIYGGEFDFVFARFAALAVEGALYRPVETTELAAGLGLLFYPFGRALQKLYVEPRAVYLRPLNALLADIQWVRDVVGVGTTVGWQWTWDYGFSMRIGSGAMYYATGARSVPSRAGLSLGPQLVLDGSLGWAF